MFRLNTVQGFDPIKVAVFSTSAHLDFEPSGFFEAAHDLANATIGEARFPGHALDRRPTFPLIVCIISQGQKNKPFRLIVWASIPDNGHNFDAHRYLLCCCGDAASNAMLLSAHPSHALCRCQRSAHRCGFLGWVERLPVLPTPIL